MAELAPITNYTTLKAAVSAMAERADEEFTDSIPLFIQQAERILFSQLRCPGNEKIGLFASADGDRTQGVTLPTDFLEAKNVIYGTTPLERVSDQRLLSLRNQSMVAGEPRYFARVSGSLYFWPVAATNADVSMVYYSDQGPIADTGSTKMLLIAPFAYLYGALEVGALFTRDAQMAQEWGQRFIGEINRLNDQAMDNEIAGSTVVVSDFASTQEGW